MRRLALTVLLASCTGEPSTDDPVDTDLVDGSVDPIDAYDPLVWVDPFVGTGGHGAEIANVNPGATMPNGMTLIGPDTRLDWGAPQFYHCAGYWYHDDHVGNFSVTHAHGMGVPDYAAVPFMPRDGWSDAYTRQAGRMAPFTHDEEWASPGRYAVVLQDHDIHVDVAATLRGGHVRFTFPAGAEPVVLLDLGQALPGNGVAEAWAEWAPGEARVEGLHRVNGSYSGRFGGVMTHFSALLDPAPESGGGWVDPDEPETGRTRVDGTTSGIWLRFPDGTSQVDLRLAVSYVDVEGARANLAAELPDADLDARVAEAEAAWRSKLERVRVRGGDDEDRFIFHTALYHALIMPSRQDDVDGRYRGLDQEIHVTDHPYYSDLSLWDTFRTLHPWYILAWPELQEDVNRSLARMVRDGGYLPKWPLAHGYTGGMVGSPAIQVLAESWQKGLTGFDADLTFDAAFLTATTPVPKAGRSGVTDYVTLGWVPVGAGKSASDTLEYAWNDHALALWADALGRDEEADVAWGLSGNWRNVWWDEVGFNTGRNRDGTFAWRDSPYDWSEGWFVEGNAWHYLWYTPYDVEGMIDLHHGGDRDAFAARTTRYWADVFEEEEDNLPDDYYWHGNEPVMHYAFLGSLAGMPDLTADPSRWVLGRKYHHDPIGLDGNDDAGTLSAWYLWASIGLFPVAGTPTYAWAPPIWERVEVDLPDGTFVVRAPGVSDERRYLRRWSVNGEPVTTSTLDHARLFGAGGDRELLVELATAPGAWPAGE